MSKVFDSLTKAEQARVEGAKALLSLPSLNKILSPAEELAFACVCSSSSESRMTAERVEELCAQLGVAEEEVSEVLRIYERSNIGYYLEYFLLARAKKYRQEQRKANRLTDEEVAAMLGLDLTV